MQDVLFFGSFFFCTRDDLERLQPLSQSLHNMIVNFSEVLPLRPIHCVSMDWDDDAEIGIMIKSSSEYDYVASTDRGDFAEIFRRLQHTCIEDFCVGIRDSAFLRYWKAQETVAFAVVDVEICKPGTMDYDVLHSIVKHLRPRTMSFEVFWLEDGDKRELAEITVHHSFLTNRQTCYLDVVDKDPFPPPAFFLARPGYSNYELYCTNRNASNGIDALIESFVRDGCANKKLDSVRVEWDLDDDQQTVARMPKQLRNPTETDLPVPYDVTVCYIPADRHKCEMYSFVNTKQRKRMEVYKWSLEWGSLD